MPACHPYKNTLRLIAVNCLATVAAVDGNLVKSTTSVVILIGSRSVLGTEYLLVAAKRARTEPWLSLSPV